MKIAVLFCISILAVTLGGCTRHGDMVRGIAADVGTMGLSLGEVCQGALEDYDRIFKCFNRAVTSYEMPREDAHVR